MNDSRRKKISEIKTEISSIINQLNNINRKLICVLDDEQDAYDNMPEGLQNSIRGINSEESIDNLEEASEMLNETIKTLNDII